MSNIPSIAMIPSAYKSGKVYSVLPTDGSGDFNFSRTSEATRVNQNGLIETVSSNVPRIDYTDGGCPKLLLEPLRRNLIEQSNNFSAWSVISNVTLDADSLISPDGENTATKIIPNSSNSTHQIRLIYSSVTNTYNFSVFAKKGEYKNILIWDDTVAEGIGVNLDDLSIFRNENVEGYKIEQHSNGWVRISYTRSYTSEQPRPSIYVYDNSATPQITFSGNGSDGLYLWGAQFEIGSYATSYIPTNGSTVTRETETASKSGLSSYINSQEGVLYAEMSALVNDDSVFKGISLNNGTVSNEVLLYTTNANNTIRAIVQSGGSIQFDNTYVVGNLKASNKVAIKYKSNDFAFWVNGVEVGVGVSGNAPIGLNTLAFDEGTGTEKYYGKVKDLRVYNTVLTDTQLQQLTS